MHKSAQLIDLNLFVISCLNLAWNGLNFYQVSLFQKINHRNIKSDKLQPAQHQRSRVSFNLENQKRIKMAKSASDQMNLANHHYFSSYIRSFSVSSSLTTLYPAILFWFYLSKLEGISLICLISRYSFCLIASLSPSMANCRATFTSGLHDSLSPR